LFIFAEILHLTRESVG